MTTNPLDAIAASASLTHSAGTELTRKRDWHMPHNPLDAIQARTDAATEGPWVQRGCTPCQERGRLEVNIWDHTGNLLITSWCDEDDDPGPDATFIAHAREDVPKLVRALRAVEAVEYMAIPDDFVYEMGYRDALKAVRAAIDEALG